MVVKPDLRRIAIEVVNRDTFRFEENLSLCSEPCRNEVFHNFLLRIDRDPAPRQGFEIDAMSLPSETNFNAIMNQAFAFHSLANTRFHQKVNSALLQNAGSYPLLAMLPTASLDDDRMNTLPVQEMREHKPRRARSDNPNLRT